MNANSTPAEDNWSLFILPSFSINASFEVLTWNTQSESAFGYVIDDFSANEQLFSQFFAQADRFVTPLFKTPKKTTQINNIQLQTKSNEIITANLILQYNKTQNCLHIVCLLQDQLQIQNDDQQAALDLTKGIHASFMTVTVDHEGFIVNANSPFLKTSSWTPKRVLGRTFWNLFPDDEQSEKIAHSIWRTLQQGSIWQGEVQKMAKTGELYWVYLTAIPVINDNKKEYTLVEHDITKDKQVQQKLEKIAYIDAETGLMNIHSLEREVNQYIYDQRHFSFVYLSIDNFYTIKELHSYTFNEGLILEFTKRLKMYFQDSTMARINENDFVILTPLPEWFVQGFLNYLQQNPIYNGSTAIPISISGGISRYPEDQTTFSGLMKASVTTIGNVRAGGGGTIVSLTKSTHAALTRKAQIEKRLLLALDQENLKVLYQPQFDVKTGKITAVEAFVRWDDEEIGVVSPDELIPVAEETGLINNIGKFMLDKACEQVLKWQRNNINLKVSINSSVREFRDKNMAKSILETLEKWNCPANLIQIEITEKFALEAEAEQSIIKQMKQLEAEGIVFTLDDFGTGYASFRYIQLLPLQILKIDQTFTNALINSERSQRLVHGMIQLGKSMNLTVLAEGVETEEQKALLESFGCDALQGYFFSKPVEADDIVHIYKKY